VTFTVGYAQKENINRAVKKVMLLICWAIKYFVAPVSVPTEKLNLYIHAISHEYTILIILLSVLQFSDNFAILLFHYDGRVSEWEEFEWSKRAIHVSVSKQTKWYATVL
jgi:hypothetical protein